MTGWSQDAFVVIVDDLFRVVHGAVTDLDSIAVDDFSELMVSRNVIAYWDKESVSDVGAEWLVVPEYVVPLSVFSFGRSMEGRLG